MQSPDLRRVLSACYILLSMVAMPLHADDGETRYTLTEATTLTDGSLYLLEQQGYVMGNTLKSGALSATSDYATDGLSGTEPYVWMLTTAKGGYRLRNVATGKFLCNSTSTEIKLVTAANTDGVLWNSTSNTDGTYTLTNAYTSRYLGLMSESRYEYKAYTEKGHPASIRFLQLVTGKPTPEETYTVTLSGIDVTLTEETPGGGIDLPMLEDVGEFHHEGWTTTPITELASVCPTLLTGHYTPEADITLYPLYQFTKAQSAMIFKEVHTPAELTTGQYVIASECQGIVAYLPNTASSVNPVIVATQAVDEAHGTITSVSDDMVWDLLLPSSSTNPNPVFVLRPHDNHALALGATSADASSGASSLRIDTEHARPWVFTSSLSCNWDIMADWVEGTSHYLRYLIVSAPDEWQAYGNSKPTISKQKGKFRLFRNQQTDLCLFTTQPELYPNVGITTTAMPLPSTATYDLSGRPSAPHGICITGGRKTINR